MAGEIFGIIVIFLGTVILAYPLGKYITRVFKGEKIFMDFMNPLERFIFRIMIDQSVHELETVLKTMLAINLLWLYMQCLCLSSR